MNVGMIGTGAIAWKHAQAYKNIGYRITACTNTTAERGLKFAEATGAEFVETVEELCKRPEIDFVDVCTFPGYRLEAVELGAQYGKHVLVQKPMAVDLETAAKMIATARKGGNSTGRGEPASLRRLGAVSEAGSDSGTAGQDSAGGCVREVVPLR